MFKTERQEPQKPVCASIDFVPFHSGFYTFLVATYIYIDKNFDIKLRKRISWLAIGRVQR